MIDDPRLRALQDGCYTDGTYEWEKDGDYWTPSPAPFGMPDEPEYEKLQRVVKNTEPLPTRDREPHTEAHDAWDAGGHCNALVLDEYGDGDVCGYVAPSLDDLSPLERAVAVMKQVSGSAGIALSPDDLDLLARALVQDGVIPTTAEWAIRSRTFRDGPFNRLELYSFGHRPYTEVEAREEVKIMTGPRGGFTPDTMHVAKRYVGGWRPA